MIARQILEGRWIVHCDIPGCRERHVGLAYHSVDSARLSAIADGWGSDSAKIDVCPKHVGTPEAEDLILPKAVR